MSSKMEYSINRHIYLNKLIFFVVLMGFSCSAYGVEFYEKPEIIERMEKREVISVVKIENHNGKRRLTLTAAGIVEGVGIPRAMEVMANYQNLTKIAPEYIKESELIVLKKKNKYEKYLHMRTVVKALLLTYKLNTYSRVWEEQNKERGAVHWNIIPASTLGRTSKQERFVGLNGFVSVQTYKRKSSPRMKANDNKRGFYRRRSRKQQMMVLFSGHLDKTESEMSKLVPNFVLQFAMEVALQRVGVLLRNYIETSKDLPPKVNLEDFVLKDKAPSPKPAATAPPK